MHQAEVYAGHAGLSPEEQRGATLAGRNSGLPPQSCRGHELWHRDQERVIYMFNSIFIIFLMLKSCLNLH